MLEDDKTLQKDDIYINPPVDDVTDQDKREGDRNVDINNLPDQTECTRFFDNYKARWT
ncbi:hypothetical protein DPMN_144781 [Dreissena polymorpha]|uniref:Uncharacterized protein n=1 Tax=Dreissena polymorpha TaxID=45954 RepID=A0A9D4J0L4_DREPO|nr:hypothetical protein DPMN_144781 [Dreissena polymorpha]